MDPFKLLVRGTKLTTSKSKDIPVLPSADPAASPTTIPRGTKRKRANHDQDEQPIETATVPNFFGSAPDQLESKSKQPKEESSQRKIIEDFDVPYIRKSEDECKQILRQHKLKVTLMHTSSKKPKKQQLKKPISQIIPQPLESFTDLRPRFKISRRLAGNLAEQGYSVPTEVQLGTIPLLLGDDEDRGIGLSKKKGRSHVDLLTIAPTGSGKTLAFLIPLIQGLLDMKHQETQEQPDESFVKAVIIAPTHELADQIANEAKKLIQGTGLRVVAMRKGMQVLAQGEQDSSADSVTKSDILVSTPLALVNAITDETTAVQSLPSVRYLVLDEADVLLDPLFREQSVAIWKACTNKQLQVSLWSATIGSSIEHLAKEIITTRQKDLAINSKNHHILRLIAGLKDSSLPTISHRLIYCATEAGKLLAIRQILHPSTASPSIPSLRPPFLIFTQTIPRASALHSELLYDISPEAGGSSRIAVLHSSLSDTARSEIMARFRKAEIWILITTDLLSRGIDFRGVNGVVNYDIPTSSAAYVHRAGRTGRAGREGGMAITLYTKEDVAYMKNVANVIAASERVHGGKNKTASGGEEASAVPKWLLDALPDVSKASKQKLKKRGVEERRAGNEGKGARISTKSGWQRGLEKRRRGAVEGSKRRKTERETGTAVAEGEGEESEWGGIED